MLKPPWACADRGVISVNSVKITDTGCLVIFSFPDFIHVFGGISYLGLVIRSAEYPKNPVVLQVLNVLFYVSS